MNKIIKRIIPILTLMFSTALSVKEIQVLETHEILEDENMFDASGLWRYRGAILRCMFQVSSVQNFLFAVYEEICESAQKERLEIVQMYRLNTIPPKMTEDMLPGMKTKIPAGEYTFDELMETLSLNRTPELKYFQLYQWPESERGSSRNYRSLFHETGFILKEESFRRFINAIINNPEVAQSANIRTMDLCALRLGVLPLPAIRQIWPKKLGAFIEGLNRDQNKDPNPQAILRQLINPPGEIDQIDLFNLVTLFCYKIDGRRNIPQEKSAQVTKTVFRKFKGLPWLEYIFKVE